MRWVIWLMCGLPFLGAGLARADERPIADRTWVLRGRAPSLATAFATGEGPVTVSLHVVASELLDRTESRITVAIDGVPLRTASLDRIADADGEASLRVVTDRLSAGNHLLEVSARLRVADDPCLARNHQDAWLRVESDSAIETVDAPALRGDDVQTLAGQLLSSASSGLQFEAPPDDEAVAALVELGAAVSRRGGVLRWVERRPDVVLRIAAQPTDDRHHRRLDELLTRFGTDALWVVDHHELVAVASGSAALHRAVTALSDETFLELCEDDEVCPVGGVSVAAVPAASPSDGTLTVRTLADLGHRDGFVVRGLGDHAVRFVENDPHRWSLVAPPVVRLPYSLPSGAGNRSYDVRVTVELNEQPIDTWVLDATTRARGEIRAELPLELARAADAWVIDVEIHTRLRDGQRCTEDEDDTTTWLRVPPDAGLDVERNETSPTGIAAFAQAASRRGATLVVDASLRAPQALLAAASWLAVVLPERVRVGRSPDGPTIRFTEVTRMPGVVAVETPDGARLRISVDGEALPLIPARSTTLMACGVGADCPELLVGLPIDGGTLPAPDFAQLSTPLAIGSEGRMRPLGTPAGPVVAHRVAGPRVDDRPASVRSVRASRLVVVDVIWAALALGVGLLGVWVHRRARSDVVVAPGNLETLSTREGEGA